jgi:hypothetical protein
VVVFVQQVPRPDDTAISIAQEIEGDVEFGLQECGASRWIDRHGRKVEPGGADGVEVITKVRQLTDTEWSPVTAVEQENDGPRLHPLGEVPRLLAGVR